MVLVEEYLSEIFKGELYISRIRVEKKLIKSSYVIKRNLERITRSEKIY